MYLKSLGGEIKKWELEHLQDYDAIVPIAAQDEAFYRAQGFDKPIKTIGGGVDLTSFAPQHPLKANLKVHFYIRSY